MANALRNATVLETGLQVQVYKGKNGKWIDYKDCNTSYNNNQLEVTGEINQD